MLCFCLWNGTVCLDHWSGEQTGKLIGDDFLVWIFKWNTASLKGAPVTSFTFISLSSWPSKFSFSTLILVLKYSPKTYTSTAWHFGILILEASISQSWRKGKDVGQLHSWSQGKPLTGFITDIRENSSFLSILNNNCDMNTASPSFWGKSKGSFKQLGAACLGGRWPPIPSEGRW